MDSFYLYYDNEIHRKNIIVLKYIQFDKKYKWKF
jgi:hypothetical protein